ncbi:MAG: hemerythrin domain-containing protein [Acetobacterium sp.]
MGKAIQDLRKEHDAILYVLQILDQMMLSKSNEGESQLRYYDELIYFLKIFVDRCHHGKEENYLFKELVKKDIPDVGDSVIVMLQEHVQSRNFIAQMSQSLNEKDINSFNNVAVQYRDLVRSHIEKEDNILFQMADKVIDETEQDILFEEFEKFEENIIGHGVHEKLHAMINTWAKAFGVE